jgi:hypothetical protein
MLVVRVKALAMEKYLGVAWLIATIISWISFGAASWFWADNIDDMGMLVLTILWLVISLVLFLVGLRFRKSSS